MNIDVVARREVSSSEWDSLVKNSQDGWVFSLWNWQDLIVSVEKWSFKDYSFAFSEGSRLLAVVPLQYHANSGRLASSAWGGSGPVISSQLNSKLRKTIMNRAIQHCLCLAKSLGASSFDLALSPVTTASLTSHWGVNPFIFYGLEDRSGLAQVIDLASNESELWDKLSPDARRQIKQARLAGLRVERVDWQKNLEHYYELHIDTYKRTGIDPHPLDYFAGIAERTALSGNSVLWAVRTTERKIIAYHNSAWFREGAYYHTGCSANMPCFPGANYLLFWEAMLGAKRSGILWYDCGNIYTDALETEKQYGLSLFKKKFGGETHRHFRAGLNLQKSESVASQAVSISTYSKKCFRALASNLRAMSQIVIQRNDR